MSWKERRLGDVLTLKRGYDLPEAQRRPGDVPVISSSGITGSHNMAMVAGPGVVTGRYGTMGEVFYVEGDYWPHNTALYVRDFKGNNPRFIAYFLKNALRGTNSNKAAVPGVNRNDLHERIVCSPDLETQGRIVEQLLPIDDLIENNHRRIALLEQSARLLYREWFVHLRFPGHEHVKVMDGVPEGWERKPLKEIATLNYGKALKEELRQPGPYPVYGSSGIVGSHVAGLTSGPGIIVGRKGNVGSVYWSPVAFFAIDTVYYIGVEQSSLYLYYALRDAQFMSTDVAVPGLNRDFAYSRQFLVPSDPLLAEFIEAVTPFHKQIEKLTLFNEKLCEARDLLLPRMMSGDLVV